MLSVAGAGPRLRRTLPFVVALSVLVGCDGDDTAASEAAGPEGKATAARSAAPAPLAAPKLPTGAPKRLENPNPLDLPPRTIELGEKKRVFTFSDRMLAGAQEGSTLVLYAATSKGMDGADVVISGRDGPDYRVHAGYVIPVPDKPRLRMNDAVLTEWAGVMRHASVARFSKGKTVVRFTDMRRKMPERHLSKARFVRQQPGLHPGNYAALRKGQTYHHVLLVSPFEDAGKARWFALGYAGAAMLVDAADLVEIPLKVTPDVGDEVWGEWLGKMRPATVVSADGPGDIIVKFARAGRPSHLGWGLWMPPVAGAPVGAPPRKP